MLLMMFHSEGYVTYGVSVTFDTTLSTQLNYNENNNLTVP